MCLPADVAPEVSEFEIEDRQNHEVIVDTEDENLNWYIKLHYLARVKMQSGS